MRRGSGRPPAALAAVALIAVAVLASPPAAAARTGCSYPFRDWIAGKPLALYRLDHGRSRWPVVMGRSRWPLVMGWSKADGCMGLAGTFVVRHIATLQGRAPAVITMLVRSAGRG